MKRGSRSHASRITRVTFFEIAVYNVLLVDNWRFRFLSFKLIFDLGACKDRMFFGICLSAEIINSRKINAEVYPVFTSDLSRKINAEVYPVFASDLSREKNIWFS